MKNTWRFVLGLSILGYFFDVFFRQFSIIFDYRNLHEEQRILYPYYTIQDPELFKDDYITTFLLSSDPPLLYGLITRYWLILGGDLLDLHRILPIALWLLLLLPITMAGWKIKGIVGALGTFGLVLVQPFFLHQITAAVPHAFAFPLLGWAIVALLYRNLAGLVILTILSAVLYSIVTPIIGLSLVGHLVFKYQKELTQLNYPVMLKVLTLAGITGSVSIILAASVFFPSQDFGAPIIPYQDVVLYPESGINGRYFYGMNEPLSYVAVKFARQFKDWLEFKWRLALALYYIFLALIGYFAIDSASSERKAVFIFLLASTFTLVAIIIVKPNLSYRFLLYPMLLIFPILVPPAITKIYSLFKSNAVSFSFSIVTVFLISWTFDACNPSKMGYQFQINDESQAVLNYIGTMPADTFFAGWPGFNESLTELIPYMAKRKVLLTHKAHYPIYTDYLLKMRVRMYALIDAYTATDVTGLNQLKLNFGVSHLLVDKRHFIKGNPIPSYFSPFDNYIQKAWEENEKNGFLLAYLDNEDVVFESENYYILQLGQ